LPIDESAHGYDLSILKALPEILRLTDLPGHVYENAYASSMERIPTRVSHQRNQGILSNTGVKNHFFNA
jgi:hypothetical protein